MEEKLLLSNEIWEETKDSRISTKSIDYFVLLWNRTSLYFVRLVESKCCAIKQITAGLETLSQATPSLQKGNR
jgi:hypothetical protein